MTQTHAPQQEIAATSVVKTPMSLPNPEKFTAMKLADFIIKYQGGYQSVLDHLPVLPKFIQKTTENISSEQKKLIMLSGVLPVTSVLFSGVKVKYQNTFYTPTISLLVIAPPASGKGVLKHAVSLTNLVREELERKNSFLKAEYNLKLEANKNKGKNKLLESSTPPIPPITPCILFPSNMTNAALIEQLKHNENGPALLISALELDTIASAFSAEHGRALNSSFRLITEQEQVDSGLKGDGNTIVARPKAAFLFASTMGQFTKLFKLNYSNGFPSRFLIMNLPNQQKFDIITGNAALSLDDQFKELSQEYSEFYKHMANKKVETIIPDDQLAKLQELGSSLLEKVVQEPSLDETATSLVFRHMNMCCRIASTLRMIEYCENKETASSVEISNEIMAWSFMYTMVSFSNSLSLFHNMSYNVEREPTYNKVLESLPSSFGRKDLQMLDSTIGVCEKTGYNSVKLLMKQGKVKKKKHGIYEKV